MRVMVIVKATADSEAGLFPEPQMSRMVEEMDRFNEALQQAGILVMGEGLKPSALGRRVAFDGPDRRVTGGPFTPAHDLVAGFWVWQVRDMDEAVAWVKRCPNPMPGPSIVEIRPFYEPGDF